MTDLVQGEGQNSGNSAPAAPVNSPAPTPAPREPERTFSQTEVNDVVGRAKSEAVERYKRETSVASHNYTPPQNAPVAPPSQQPYAPHQPQQPAAQSEDRMRQLAAEEIQRQRNEWVTESHKNAQEQEAARIATDFFTKVNAGKANIPDFDTVMSNVDLGSIPYHVQLASMVDNTAEVMYELAKNPVKIGQLQTLIDIDMRAGRTPKLALAELQKLSQSIKDNAQASKQREPNQPLGQMRPSNAGTDSKGPLTASDYRRRYKL